MKPFREGNQFLGMALGDKSLEEFSPIPGTSKEVNEISGLYANEKVFIKDENLISHLRQESNKYNIVHLATHGVFNKNEPIYSYLVFVPEQEEDGKLTASEVFGLNLTDNKVVTLSACETGLGSVSQGDELVGLSRAFIYAGAPSVIVSLWSVSDESTANIMVSMYNYLKNYPLQKSLAMAQRDEMKKNNKPFFWAPFVIIGNGKVQ
jgi:CHAT domain-containing protein